MTTSRLHRRVRFTCLLLLGLTAGLLFWYFSPFFSPGENRRFETYLERLFCAEVCSSTLNLHYTLADPHLAGIDTYPVTLGSVRLPDPAASAAYCENQSAVLSSFHPQKLSRANQITLSILSFELESEKMPESNSLLQEPLGPSLGIQAQLPVLLAEYTFRTRTDVLDYLKLLKDLPRYFSELLSFEQEKSRAGVFMNDACADGVIAQCSAFIRDPEHHYLQELFAKKLAASGLFTEAEQQVCLDTHRELMLSCVVPAYQSLIDGLTALKGTGSNPGGLARFAGGRDYYCYLLRRQVGTDASPEELEERLLLQLSLDTSRIQSLLQAEPSLALLLNRTELPFSSPDEMLEDLKEAILQDFPPLPEVSYDVKYVEKSLEEFLSPAFYLTPPVDTNTPNAIYINSCSSMNPLELYTTLAHEGFPGHLYQTVSFARTDAPLARHLHTVSGYVEGWATYVEAYAYGYAGRNGTDDIRSVFELQQLNRSVSLCLYSLLDLGIHYHGWLEEDAAAFLEKFGFTDSETVRTIYQYIVETPGNYLKYYVGYLNFLDLREEFRRRLGNDFSLLSFHERLLEIGPAPFPVVRSYLAA